MGWNPSTVRTDGVVTPSPDRKRTAAGRISMPSPQYSDSLRTKDRLQLFIPHSRKSIFLVGFKQLHTTCCPNMEAPPLEDIPKLCWIIQELKGMDDSWREDSSAAPPTAEEQALYQLLLLHTYSEFSLFHREKFLRQLNQNENRVEFIIKELRDWKHARSEPPICIPFKGEEGSDSDEDDESYSEHAEELANTYAPLGLLIELLGECRRSIAKQYLLEECSLSIAKLKLPARSITGSIFTSDVEIQGGGKAEEMTTPTQTAAADCCAEAMMEEDELLDVEEEEARADTLRNMLSYLEDMRRDRAYAPPKVDELECYREIRKLITSTYMHFHAKGEWQGSWRQPDWLRRCSMPDSECFFAQVIPRICNGDWRIPVIETDEGILCPPKGHIFELVFDEMPDAKSLLINCKRKLSDTFRGLSSEKKIDWRGAVKCSYNSVKACSRKSVGGKHLREKLLISILKAFRRMNSLCSMTPPTSREVRLFDRIAEHVREKLLISFLPSRTS